MPKQLLMMRHAKSSWDSGVDSDHQRPLNKRGRRDAPAMATWLIDNDAVPEFIVSSDACRTVETCERMLPTFEANGQEPKVLFEESLYHAPANEWEDVLVEIGGDVQRVMFLGHNPGAAEFVGKYSGEHHTMPTAAIAFFEFAVSQWDECKPSNAILHNVWRPKEVLFQD